MSLVARIQNRAGRLRQRPWRNRAYESRESHLIIGGAPRSGTTLLRRVIDRHPGICCGPESGILLPGGFHVSSVAAAYRMPESELRAMLDASGSQGAFVDAFATRYRETRGRPRWAEKTPLNIQSLDWILERFPKAQVIHVIRDGRDVVCSMRQHPERRWVDGEEVRELRPRPVAEYAHRWVRDVEEGMRFRGDPRYHELRYEAFVTDPAQVLADLLVSVDETWEPSILVEKTPRGGKKAHANTAITPRSVGRWRTDLTADEQREAHAIMGPLMRSLDYPLD